MNSQRPCERRTTANSDLGQRTTDAVFGREDAVVPGSSASTCLGDVGVTFGWPDEFRVMGLSIVDTARPVTGGVDSHVDLNVAAALDGIGGLLHKSGEHSGQYG